MGSRYKVERNRNSFGSINNVRVEAERTIIVNLNLTFLALKLEFVHGILSTIYII